MVEMNREIALHRQYLNECIIFKLFLSSPFSSNLVKFQLINSSVNYTFNAEKVEIRRALNSALFNNLSWSLSNF